MPFELRDHTADVLADCTGENLAELMDAAMRALYAVTVVDSVPERDEVRTLQFYVYSNEELLVRWLQEVLYLLDKENFIATLNSVMQPEEDRFISRLEGYVASSIERASEIKGVTYHNLEVRQSGSGLRAAIVFDL